jgi:soluble P-type ATPase
MITIDVPGHKLFKLKHLVLDYNGTLACDGQLISGVKEKLEILEESIQVYILTADTFQSVSSFLQGISCQFQIISSVKQDVRKLEYIRHLGTEFTVCIGNGRNDSLMLKEAAIGIAVILNEGAALETLLSADVVCTDILSALELLLNPLRLTATLRS